ncbi:MAG: PilZ domain-containing protein [Pseudomonadota bacterium]
MARDYKHYEELGGAEGRDLFFRPARHSGAQLFGGIQPTVRFGEEPCALADLSMAGIGFFSKQTLLEEERAPVSISVGGRLIFQADAEVRWCEQKGSRARVGARFVNRQLDLDAVVGQARLASTLEAIAGSRRRKIDPVPERYRALSMELLCLLRRTRERLDELELQVGPLTEARRDELVAEIEPPFFEALNPIWLEMNEIAVSQELRSSDRKAVKEFTALTLRPEFMDGPVWRRSTEKPFGYPGDYKVMLAAYGDPAGPCSLYGAVLHKVMAWRVGACIRGRKELMRAALERELGRGESSEAPMRVTNLGAGPAREIRDLLSADLLRRPINVNLVDQDAQALQCAMDQSADQRQKHSGRATMTGLCASYLDILKKGRLYDQIQDQDVIYSLGLIDYFKDASVRSLVRGMYEKLRPGGLLALCNMKAGPRSLYLPLDLICDWELIYRDEAQMRAFAKGLGGDAGAPEVDVVAEPSDRVLMLFVRKPHATPGQ